MPRKSKRELKRNLDDLENGPVDAPPLEELMIYDTKRAHGEIDDPLSDEEFTQIWERAWQQYNDEP